MVTLSYLIKVGACVAVIREMPDVREASLGRVVLQEPFLIGDAVAFTNQLVIS